MRLFPRRAGAAGGAGPSTRPVSPIRPRSGWSRAALTDAALVLLGVLLSALFAFPELVNRLPDLNDNTLHRGIIGRMAEAMGRGEDPTDAWFSEWMLGLPMLHSYPFLGHLIAALPVAATGGAVSALESLRFFTWLLLTLLPVSMYVLMRAWPIPRPGPALAALAVPLVAAGGLFGLSFETYTWAGYGLFPQLWGAALGPLAAAAGLKAVRGARNAVGAGILLGIAWLCHPLFGYVAAGTVVLATLLESHRRAWLRAAYLSGSAAATALPLLAPLVLDRAFTGFSVWDDAWRRDSWGWGFVIGRLATGRILDDGRAPVLSLVAWVGTVVALRSLFRRGNPGGFPDGGREAALGRAMLLGSLAVWVTAYIGRAGVGQVVDLLPLAQTIHLHRIVVGVQWALLGLFGLGGAWLWKRLGWVGGVRRLGLAATLTALCLLPAVMERHRASRVGAQWVERTGKALAAQPELGRLAEYLKAEPPGRVYAGPAAGWGGELKVGDVPVYAVLSSFGFDVVSYIYIYSMTSDLLPVFDPGRPGHLDVTNVRYVVSGPDRDFPHLELVRSDGRYRVWRADTGGYLRVADAVQVWRATPEDRLRGGPAVARAAVLASIEWMRSGEPETGRHWLMEPPSGWAPVEADLTHPPPGAAPPGRVEDERVSAGTYSGTVTLDRDGFVVLKSSYDPHWQATLDGVAARTWFVSPGFVAVRASTGRHDVTFRYRYSRSLWVLASVPLLGLLGWLDRRSRRVTPTQEVLEGGEIDAEVQFPDNGE